MAGNIFANNAPLYYAKGLQVIPLFESEKRPIPSNWSKYAESEVEPSLQEAWINSHPHANIGLVLGDQSGVTVIDIDTDDAALFTAITSVLPPSPWARRGKKGIMLAFKTSKLRTFRIKNATGEMIVECLSKGAQCVLPPSIHPDTRLPYESNSHLYEVLDKLNFLPEDIETKLREVLTSHGVKLSHSGWSKVTEFVSAGSRDTTLTELAGLFAFAVVRGERTLKEAIGMLISYQDTFIQKVAGDEVDMNKHVSNLVKFLHRDVLEKNKVLPKGWNEGYTPEELVNLGVTLDDTNTEWDFEEARIYLHTVFENTRPGSKDRVEAIEIVLDKICKSTQFSKIDEDRILGYIVDVSGMNIKLATLRSRLKELRMGPVKGTDHSEIARAVLKDLSTYMTIRFHKEQFWKWSGSHWEPLGKDVLKAKISQGYGHLDACRKNSDILGILNIMTFLCEEGIQRVNTPGVNFANGYLCQDLVLRPHDKDFGMIYTLPFRYMPELAGDFPRFERFLNQCWGKDEDYDQKRDALQEALAVTLFGVGSTYQRAVLLHGAPKSGKSQLLRIVQCLVPEEAKCAVPPEDWSDKFIPAMMLGKILNVCGELSEDRKINGQKFKDTVDGSDTTGQFKNQPVFTFKPVCAHWFASNHFPRTTDTSSGFIRRWLVLNFNKPVANAERIADIGDLIAAEEREPIVAWAALAILRMIKNAEFTLPKSHTEIVYEISNLNNSVKFFLEESPKIQLRTPEGSVSEIKLYNVYWAFCATAGGMKPVPAGKFRAMLRELQSELDFSMTMHTALGGGIECLIKGLKLR